MLGNLSCWIDNPAFRILFLQKQIFIFSPHLCPCVPASNYSSMKGFSFIFRHKHPHHMIYNVFCKVDWLFRHVTISTEFCGMLSLCLGINISSISFNPSLERNFSSENIFMYLLTSFTIKCNHLAYNSCVLVTLHRHFSHHWNWTTDAECGSSLTILIRAMWEFKQKMALLLSQLWRIFKRFLSAVI